MAEDADKTAAQADTSPSVVAPLPAPESTVRVDSKPETSKESAPSVDSAKPVAKPSTEPVTEPVPTAPAVAIPSIPLPLGVVIH